MGGWEYHDQIREILTGWLVGTMLMLIIERLYRDSCEVIKWKIISRRDSIGHILIGHGSRTIDQ